MRHRHLNHQDYTLAAIDDVIARGKIQDWIALRQALRQQPLLLGKVLRICKKHLNDSFAQRYYFWKHYAERYLT